MGKFSLEKLFGMTIRESATDGSDFTNPDADYRRLFLGEDGQLHVKDSAGTVTDIGVAGGAVATDAIWDAKGDLAGGTGANTAAKLTVGANGLVLAAASGETTGLKWQVHSAFHGCRVYNTGSVALGTATETPITFDTERFDTDAFHDTGSNTDRITIPSGLDGKYLIVGHVRMTSTPGTPAYAAIQLNGTTKIALQEVVNDAVACCTVEAIYALAATDYVQLLGYATTAGKSAITSGNYSNEFSVTLLGV